MLAARDPWPNLLRLTAAGFAGAVGGADAVVLDGFSRAVGRPDAFARRQARNTQLVLMEEANIGRVADPAAGSWFLDHRTRDLADAGWAEFQRIEARAGSSPPCAAAPIQQRVAASRAVGRPPWPTAAARSSGSPSSSTPTCARRRSRPEPVRRRSRAAATPASP